MRARRSPQVGIVFGASGGFNGAAHLRARRFGERDEMRGRISVASTGPRTCARGDAIPPHFSRCFCSRFNGAAHLRARR